MKVEFYKHNITEEEISAINEVLRSTFLTTASKTKQFEEALAQYTGNKFGVGVMSCTQGLELVLRAFDIQPGDEVITTPLSFIATANSVEYVGAKPVFVDVEANTGNIDANLIEAAITEKTKAIMLVHLYGQMCDMKKINQIAQKHNLKVIEDCAHCIEGERDGIKPGNLSDAAVYSFYATKNITCGEGGAITVNDPELYEWLKIGRLHGMSKNAADRYTKKYEHYDMEILGMKCNMADPQAALLLPQLQKIETYLAAKENICQQYNAGFANNPSIKTPTVIPGKHARHLYTIWVSPEKRDQLLNQIQERQIGIAVNFRSIHLMKFYREKYGYQSGDYPITEQIADSTITLPLYPKLTSEEINHVIQTVNELTS